MSAQPLELPKVSSAQAKLSRLLSCLQADYGITIAGQPTSIQLSTSEHQHSFGYQLNLNINNTPATIELDAQAVSLLLPGKLDHNAVSVLPSELLMGALHYTLTPTLQEAAHVFGIPIEIAGLTSGSTHTEKAAVLMSANVGGVQCAARLSTSEIILSLLNALPKRHTAQAPDIPVRVAIELGRSMLSSKDLTDLEMGDIVFLQQHVTGQQVIIRLNPQTAFIAEAEEETITIQQRMVTMDDEQPDEYGEEGVDLSDLSIELLFEIGQQQFNASDLAGLQPGFIFELDRPIEQPVRIRANGKVIAECQLVQVENRLGAKITKLNKG